MAAIESLSTSARTDALLRITQAIEAATTLDELLMLALSEFTQLFDVASGTVMLLSEEGSSGQIVSQFPPLLGPVAPISITSASRLWDVISTRQPVQIRDLEAARSEPLIEQFLYQHGARSALLMPLVAQDRTNGVLILSSPNPARYFSNDEITLVRVLGGQLAAAMVAFRLSDAARLRNEELSTLSEIASAVTSTLDEHEVYLLIVQKLNKYFKVDAGSILLIDETSGDLRFVMTIEGGKEVLVGKQVPVGQGVVGHVAQTGQWEIVPDAQRDPRFYRKISEEIGYVTRSILCVPLVAKGHVIGVIELLNKLNGPFSEDDANRLVRMAAFIGVALQNARLFHQIADGRDRLAAILNSTADGILMTDLAGVVVSANPMAARLFEASEAELLGRQLDDLLQELHAQAHDVISRPWGNSNAPDQEGALSVTEIELGGQRRGFVRHLTLPVRDAAGEVYGRLALFRDITDERELEQLRDDYTHMLVHDLRAPLTSVLNGIAMVQRGLGGPTTEQQQELLAIARSGGQTMLELVNNLLDISRMEQGRLQLRLNSTSPYTIINESVDRLRASARSQQIRIERQLAEGLPDVLADKDKIVRVLQNLLDNALKFSPSYGVVTLGAQQYHAPGSRPTDLPVTPPLDSGDWLVLWVQDQGPGIPAAYHERIFEKFGQVRNHKVRGTGLGLTFCKLSVEAHGGRIWLESIEGAGSTFAFVLPLSSLPSDTAGAG